MHADAQRWNDRYRQASGPRRFEPDARLQKAFQLGIKKEKSAIRMYSDMARACRDEKTRWTFKNLAEEEDKHREHLETEYEEQFGLAD